MTGEATTQQPEPTLEPRDIVIFPHLARSVQPRLCHPRAGPCGKASCQCSLRSSVRTRLHYVPRLDSGSADPSSCQIRRHDLPSGLFCLLPSAHAFGAGNIPSWGHLEGKGEPSAVSVQAVGRDEHYDLTSCSGMSRFPWQRSDTATSKTLSQSSSRNPAGS